MCVVDRFARLGIPGLQRLVIIGENANDIEMRDIPEMDAGQVFKFATKHQMKKLRS